MNLPKVISRRLVPMLVAAFVAAAFFACSPRKNTAATRKYQAFITRYNIHYNGDTHFKETLKKMEDSYEDDYSSGLVMTHPIEAKGKAEAPQPTGNFDRSIEKAQKAIQLRSIKKRPARKAGRSDAAYKAWLKREEYNPFLHNSWMMMGRSQYYNGDFLGAASTFYYVSRHFSWLPATVTEAKLWQARSYVSLDWLFEGEMILTRIKSDELTNSTLKGLYNLTWADYYIKRHEYAEAIPYLKEAIRYADGSQKTRLHFLLGQLYSRTGDKAAAFNEFKEAGSSPSASYRTKLNARIKQSEVYTGANIEPEVKALKRMTRYDRNKDYLDQIYYAIGNLYLSRGDTTHAIENYELAAEKSTRGGIDKAINQLTLGSLYFDRRNYAKAQPCYAEAVPMLPKDYPGYDTLKLRSDVLDELAVYSENVNLQDSLLRLSEMSEEERDKVIDKLIKELKEKEKKEAEEARREEYLANEAAAGNRLNNTSKAPNAFNINTDNSWYFYNTATRNAGKTEFQRRWGSRRLEDDWRRRNKATFNMDDFGTDTDATGDDNPDGDGGDNPDSRDEKDEQEVDKTSDPHYPEYYLAQIPQTPEEKALAHEIIQEGLYNMGIILKDKLDDYSAARAEFNRLLADYPDNVYRLEVYYNMYLMCMRHDDRTAAEKWRALILEDFPDSPYGQAMRDPNYIDNLRMMDRRQEQLYADTYEAYLDNRNDAVHAAYEEMASKYPLSRIMPKFMFLHALAYVTEKQPDEFNAVLREMLERYPDTDITPTASAWLKGMAQGRELQAGIGGNLRGMIWDLRLTNDSTSIAPDSVKFELNPDDRQLLVMTFPTDEVSSNALLYEIARHNFKSFVVKDFDLEQLNFGRLGMIVIRDFENEDELNHYRRVMAASPTLRLPAGVRPIAISTKNFETLLNSGSSFDEYFRYLRDRNYEDTEAAILDEITDAPATPADEDSEEIILPEDTDAEAEEIEIALPVDAATDQSGSDTPTSEPSESPAEQPETPAAATVPAVPDDEPPVAVPLPRRPANVPLYDPGSEGDDDPLLD